ncbi:uncharacterized protein LOC136065614 [Quercus suber]|uniref:uncharacterized protein LOC136065614 n=1 Tax=Quercus suber TaxID=58331 RepID=UPI0032E018F9
MVSELIDKENASWKTEVVDALFLPHEVEVIKSTPLSVHLLADKQAWACSSNGVFTVRSAYWVAVEMSKGVGNGACFDGRQNRKFWRMIWELATPQNIRHFTWRACRDILPTKANLVRRRVLMEDLCDGCKLALENSNHCFWTCKFACEMWESSKLALPFEPDRDCSFKDLMWVLLMEEDSTPEKAAKVATYAWALWEIEMRLEWVVNASLGWLCFRRQYNIWRNTMLFWILTQNTCMPRPQQVTWVPPQGHQPRLSTTS